MRYRAAAGFALAAMLGALPVRAQVALDQRALEGLQATPPAPKPAPRQQPRVQVAPNRPSSPGRDAAPERTGPRTQQPPAVRLVPGAPPVVPQAAPVVPVIPPPTAVPVAPPLPPAPAPVAADAPGEATAIPGGTRVSFGPGRSDLNPATEQALREVGRALKANEASTVSLLAYAQGRPEDPSTPRRLSLARALAARTVLMSEGVASTRIYVRALGSASVDPPVDRVDVVQSTPAAKPTP